MKLRFATPDDFAAILSLIKELAEFENAADSVTNTVAQMQIEQEYFNVIVAETEDSEIVGMAMYYFVYYSWVGKSLYLDDLYVKQTHRGQQIGTKLLERLFEIARVENCKRVRWQVLDWNTLALELYKKLGAKVETEWLNCDFDVNGITEFKI